MATEPSAASKFDSSAKTKVPGTKDAILKTGQKGAGMTRTGGAVSTGAGQIMQQVTKP
jgi:hypothetical protein